MSDHRRHRNEARSVTRAALLALALGVVATVATSTSALAAVGRFQFVYGNVSVTSKDGVVREVRRGSTVEEGDMISTTQRGSAQLKMADGAAIAVRPRSSVRIDNYQFNNDSKTDRSFFSLLRGTLRSITGLVGRNNRQSYRVSTETATIGIRGSDADIGYNPETGITAVRTYSGGHSLTANDGAGIAITVETNPGQIAIARPGSTPTFAKTFPFAAPAPKPQRAAGQARPRPPGAQQANVPAPTDSAQQLNAAGNRPRAPVSNSIPRGTFALSNPKIAPIGTPTAGAVLFNTPSQKKAFSGTVSAGQNATVVLDGQNRPLAITGSTVKFFANGAATAGPSKGFTIRDSAGNVASQGKWGAYAPGFTIVVNGTVRAAVGKFHFALASNPSTVSAVQALGGTSFSYDFTGNVNFSNELAQVAQSSNASLTGTGNGGVRVMISASFASGRNYVMDGTGGIGAFVGSNGIQLSAINGDNVGALGNASGRFVGTNAEGVVMSVSARKGISGKGFAGTAVGKRQ